MSELIDHEQMDKERGAVARYSAILEAILRDHFNAVGSGLGQKLKSVEDSIPYLLRRDLWHVVTQRNDSIHDHNYKFKNFPKLEFSFQSAINELNRMVELRIEQEKALDAARVARITENEIASEVVEIAGVFEQEIDAVDQENRVVPIKLGGAGWIYLELQENPFLAFGRDEKVQTSFVYGIRRSEPSVMTKYISNPFIEVGFDARLDNSEEFVFYAAGLSLTGQQLVVHAVEVPEQQPIHEYKSEMKSIPFKSWLLIAVTVYIAFVIVVSLGKALYSLFTEGISTGFLLTLAVLIGCFGTIWFFGMLSGAFIKRGRRYNDDRR